VRLLMHLSFSPCAPALNDATIQRGFAVTRQWNRPVAGRYMTLSMSTSLHGKTWERCNS